MKNDQQKSTTRNIVTGVAVAVLAVMGVSMNVNQPVVHAAADKTVMIDPAQLPLPVTATIPGAVAVRASQSGTWNVGLTGTSPVSIAGGTSNVNINNNGFATPLWTTRSDNSALHSFTYVLTTPFSGAASVFHTTQIATVPAGVRYVIEHYSVVCTVPNGGTLADVAVTVNEGNYIRDDAQPHQLGGTSFVTGWAGNGSTKLYADAGAVIFIGAVANGANLESCNGEISGYAVSLP